MQSDNDIGGVVARLAGCGKTRLLRPTSRFAHGPSRIKIARRMRKKRPSSKAAASEKARRTLRYVEPLSEARTPLADFFCILLEQCGHLLVLW